MCYQTRLIKKREEILVRFNAEIDALNAYDPTEFCSAFDFPKTPVITDKEPKNIQLFHWGLIPSWSQDTAIRNYTLNARIETLNEKRSFKDVVQNRCLIIADGFYEWKWLTKNGSKKQKFLITLPNASLFSFAGIHSEWTDFEGSTFNSYALITTQANELMSEIHNTKKRMPVILEKTDEQLWLEGEDYKKFAFPYSCDLMASALDPQNLNQLDLF